MTVRSTARLLRVVDANLNRVREGLRVCEDVVRLVLGSRRSFRRVRSLRYALNDCARRLPCSPVELARSRDSRGDLGRRAAPSRAASAQQLLLINLQRSKEALRVLEECSRVLCPRHVGGFQRLRFHAYDVERDLLLLLAPVRHRRRLRRANP